MILQNKVLFLFKSQQTQHKLQALILFKRAALNLQVDQAFQSSNKQLQLQINLKNPKNSLKQNQLKTKRTKSRRKPQMCLATNPVCNLKNLKHLLVNNLHQPQLQTHFQQNPPKSMKQSSFQNQKNKFLINHTWIV